MSLRRTMTIAALGISALVPTLARAGDVETAAGCVFRNREVESVTPYKEQIRVGKVHYPTLGGATVNIKAEPGLSVEWLRVELGDRAKACGADTDQVTMVVERRTAGYAVRLIGQDTSAAKSILQQAKGLL